MSFCNSGEKEHIGPQTFSTIWACLWAKEVDTYQHKTKYTFVIINVDETIKTKYSYKKSSENICHIFLKKLYLDYNSDIRSTDPGPNKKVQTLKFRREEKNLTEFI